MKCIKFNSKYGGHVVRVTNEEAATAVKENQAIYAPKHWWKAVKLIELEMSKK